VTAAEAVAFMREHGGRVYRMMAPPGVFCLTGDVKLKNWLLERGARLFADAYRRAAGGSTEWDVNLVPLQVEGSIWEAAR